MKVVKALESGYIYNIYLIIFKPVIPDDTTEVRKMGIKLYMIFLDNLKEKKIIL